MKHLPQATNEKKAFFNDKMCHHALSLNPMGKSLIRLKLLRIFI